MPTLYDILEVSPEASPEVIRVAYRSLAAKYHPDRGSSGELFKLIADAYETLSDPNKRAAYDAMMATAAPRPVATDTIPQPPSGDDAIRARNANWGRYAGTAFGYLIVIGIGWFLWHHYGPGAPVPLRTDGIYGSSSGSYLRFYPDGSVISVSMGSDAVKPSPQWFTPDSNSSLGRGKVSRDGDKVSFTETTAVPGNKPVIVDYSGTVSAGDRLHLHIFSQATQYSADTDYHFIENGKW